VAARGRLDDVVDAVGGLKDEIRRQTNRYQTLVRTGAFDRHGIPG
jgi:hypothetical protein